MEAKGVHATALLVIFRTVKSKLKDEYKTTAELIIYTRKVERRKNEGQNILDDNCVG